MEANSKVKFSIPILLLTWKRKENIKDLINILRRINASRIYVSSDGFKQIRSNLNEIGNIIDTNLGYKMLYQRPLIGF